MPASSMCCWMPPIHVSRPVAERVHVELHGVVEEAVDQDGVLGRARDRRFACTPRGAPRRRRPPSRGRRGRRTGARRAGTRCGAPASSASVVGPRLGVRRRREAELAEQPPEAAAVLGEIDRLGRGPPDRVARRLERARELQRRLAAELHEDPVGPLVVEHGRDVLEGQRLEVEAVRGVVVGRDRLGVAVDHDGLEAGLRERVAGVDAAVVELDALPDPVGPAAEDRDLGPVGAERFVLVLVGRVEVGRLRLELGGAGVDRLVDGDDAELLPAPADGAPRRTPSCGRARGPRARGAWRRAAPRATRRRASRPRSPPRSRPSAARRPGTTDRSACAAATSSTLIPARNARRRWKSRSAVGSSSFARSSSRRQRARGRRRGRPGPISSERIALPSASGNVRPIAIASPTDFIWIVSRLSARGNFSKVQRGILTTT